MKSSTVPARTGLILQATLPLPPSINRMYKNVPGVGRVAMPELTQFKGESQDIFAKTPAQDKDAISLIRTHYEKSSYLPLLLEIVFYYKTMWKVDVDSGIKAVQDAVFQYLSEIPPRLKVSDTLVIDLAVQKRANRENPHCKIRLSFAQTFAQIGGEEW